MTPGSALTLDSIPALKMGGGFWFKDAVMIKLIIYSMIIATFGFQSLALI